MSRGRITTGLREASQPDRREPLGHSLLEDPDSEHRPHTLSEYRWQDRQTETPHTLQRRAQLKATSGFEPLYEALQASA